MRRKIKVLFSLLGVLNLPASGCKPSVLKRGGLQSSTLTIQSVTNSGDTSVTRTAASGVGYSSVLVDQGTQFLSSNICSTATIFGLTGTSSCALDEALFRSNVYRTLGTTQISQIAETSTYSGANGQSTLPTGHREIASYASEDTDRYQAIAVGNNVYGTRPSLACGSSGSVTARIADCASKNTDRATWSPSTLGPGGQVSWKLVYSSGNSSGTCSIAAEECLEVWQDQATGLIWSASLSRSALAGTLGVNWCLASGNADATDPSATCPPNGTYQSVAAASYCAEDGTLVAVPGFCNDNDGTHITSGSCTVPNWTANAENYASGTYSKAKGMMGANSTDIVRWRLPTRDDYLQANIDGIRFVVPDLGAQGGTQNRPNDGSPGAVSTREWSATIYSVDRSRAWTFTTDIGGVGNFTRSSVYRVRCVGR